MVTAPPFAQFHSHLVIFFFFALMAIALIGGLLELCDKLFHWFYRFACRFPFKISNWFDSVIPRTASIPILCVREYRLLKQAIYHNHTLSWYLYRRCKSSNFFEVRFSGCYSNYFAGTSKVDPNILSPRELTSFKWVHKQAVDKNDPKNVDMCSHDVFIRDCCP